MELRYKVDLMAALKEKGYPYTRLRNEHLLSESVMQKIRRDEMLSIESIGKICSLLGCQISDLVDVLE